MEREKKEKTNATEYIHIFLKLILITEFFLIQNCASKSNFIERSPSISGQKSRFARTSADSDFLTLTLAFLNSFVFALDT